MDIIIIKPDLVVSKTASSQTNNPIRLGSGEILSNAKIIASLPIVDNVYIFTSLSNKIMLSKIAEKISLVSFECFMLFNKLVQNKNNVLFCWCGYSDFYGGRPLTPFIKSYDLMAKWPHKKAYIITDNRCAMWPINISKKYGKKFNDPVWINFAKYLKNCDFENWSESTDLFVQSRDLNAIKDLISKKPVNKFKSINHISLEYIPLTTHQVKFNPDPQIKCFFSSQNFKTLTPYRIKTLLNYLTSYKEITLTGYNTQEVFKKFDLDTNLYPEPYPPVDYSQFKNQLYCGYSQLVLSEKEYETTKLMPNRLTEGVASNLVNFVNLSVDKDKEYFKKSPELQDFLYIENGADLEYRVNLLLKDKLFFKHICEEQHKCAGIEELEELKIQYLNYITNEE